MTIHEDLDTIRMAISTGQKSVRKDLAQHALDRVSNFFAGKVPPLFDGQDEDRARALLEIGFDLGVQEGTTLAPHAIANPFRRASTKITDAFPGCGGEPKQIEARSTREGQALSAAPALGPWLCPSCRKYYSHDCAECNPRPDDS